MGKNRNESSDITLVIFMNGQVFLTGNIVRKGFYIYPAGNRTEPQIIFWNQTPNYFFEEPNVCDRLEQFD